MFWLGILLLFSGLTGLFKGYSHVLTVLLSLEVMMLGLLWLMGVLLSGISTGVYFILCFIVLMVGEGVLGLSILVSLIRWYGGDFYYGFNSLQC